MLNQLLLQVGNLIKQKKNNEVFEITCLSNWIPQKDIELNRLIETYQICGIVQHDFDGKVWQYRATASSNYAIYIPDNDLVSKANELFSKAELYKDMTGYSKELQEYCRELSSVATQIIDTQLEFINFNDSIIKILLGKIGLEMAMAYNCEYSRVSLGGDPYITKLHNLHEVCAKHLLNH